MELDNLQKAREKALDKKETTKLPDVKKTPTLNPIDSSYLSFDIFNTLNQHLQQQQTQETPTSPELKKKSSRPSINV